MGRPKGRHTSELEEKQLLAKIIARGPSGLKEALEHGVTAEMFYYEDCRECFRVLHSSFMANETRGQVFTRTSVESMFDSINLPETPHANMESLTLPIKRGHVAVRLDKLMVNVAAQNAVDPYAALRLIQSEIQGLNTQIHKSRDILLADTTDALEQAYWDAKKGLIKGVPWPWKQFNELTRGMQRQDFTIIFGRTKQMKTWIALLIAAHCYLFDDHARILLLTCELPPPLMRQRLAALIAGVNYDLLKKGNLSRREEAEYFHTLRQLKRREAKLAKDKYAPGILICDNSEGQGGVTHLSSRIESFHPDWVIVDSWYKMVNDRTGRRSMRWEDQAALIQDLKDLTKTRNLPILGVTQKKRGGGNEASRSMIEEDLEDMSYSDAAGQEADLIIRVKKRGKTSKKEVLLELKIAGAREIDANGFIIAFQPAYQSKLVAMLDDRGEPEAVNEYGAEVINDMFAQEAIAKDRIQQLKNRAKKSVVPERNNTIPNDGEVVDPEEVLAIPSNDDAKEMR